MENLRESLKNSLRTTWELFLVNTPLEVHNWREITPKILIGCSTWENNDIATELFESRIRLLNFLLE